MSELQVNKANFRETRLVTTGTTTASSALETGEVLVKIERFAFTANNITYAVTGEKIGYWQFFPANQNEQQNWGIVPVWGFARVVASQHEQIPVGERLYGYFPPAEYLKMAPESVSDGKLIDGIAHRASLPSGYNQYYRVAAEPGYNPQFDNHRMLLWPLHITSFCLWDKLSANQWYGAQQIILISASSKTSWGLAYALQDDADAPQVVGITSQRNLDFVAQLNTYDQCVTYEQLSAIQADKTAVVVDFSGNAALTQALSQKLGDNLKYTINVGLTHWDEQHNPMAKSENSEFFFAPGHIKQRFADWGAATFEQKSTRFIMSTAQKSSSWLTFNVHNDLSAFKDVYADVIDGQIPANEGVIVVMPES